MHETLSSHPIAIAQVPEFMRTLESTRTRLGTLEWRRHVGRDKELKRWRFFLMLDPYTRWGRVKPRGYAGDATLMDFAYRHPTIAPEVESAGEVGSAIYSITSSSRSSESARLRLVQLASQIETLACQRGSLSIHSFASGHARELELLTPQASAAVTAFTALDTDAESLRVARQSAGNIPFFGLECNAVTGGIDHLAPSSLVYSLGLFDYLNDALALDTLMRMWAKTEPEGVAIMANLATDAADLGYCEAIMDWWMIPRDRAQMLALAQALDDRCGQVAEARVERHGCFFYLRLSKRA